MLLSCSHDQVGLHDDLSLLMQVPQPAACLDFCACPDVRLPHIGKLINHTTPRNTDLCRIKAIERAMQLARIRPSAYATGNRSRCVPFEGICSHVYVHVQTSTRSRHSYDRDMLMRIRLSPWNDATKSRGPHLLVHDMASPFSCPHGEAGEARHLNQPHFPRVTEEVGWRPWAWRRGLCPGFPKRVGGHCITRAKDVIRCRNSTRILPR